MFSCFFVDPKKRPRTCFFLFLLGLFLVHFFSRRRLSLRQEKLRRPRIGGDVGFVSHSREKMMLILATTVFLEARSLAQTETRETHFHPIYSYFDIFCILSLWAWNF